MEYTIRKVTMQRTKTRAECLKLSYLNKSDISNLLKVSQYKAKRIYDAADQIDRQLTFRAEPAKVRMRSVLKVAGIDYSLLSRQIKDNA